MARSAAAHSAQIAVLLALLVAVFAPLAAGSHVKLSVDIPRLNAKMKGSMRRLRHNVLQLTDILVPPALDCELTAQIQPTDTCTSIS